MSRQQSESIAQLAAALVVAQGQMKGAAADSENPHFQSRYADLASVWEACRQALTDNGFSVVQLPSAAGANVTVTTILLHKSGEWISGDLTLTASRASCQDVGSAITYARRYALAAMVGVAPEDDDAESASGRGQTQRVERISGAEKKNLFALAETHGRTQEQLRGIISRHGFRASGEITREKYGAICDEIKGADK